MEQVYNLRSKRVSNRILNKLKKVRGQTELETEIKKNRGWNNNILSRKNTFLFSFDFLWQKTGSNLDSLPKEKGAVECLRLDKREKRHKAHDSLP